MADGDTPLVVGHGQSLVARGRERKVQAPFASIGLSTT